MSEITCEFIIRRRAKNGKPTLCGTRAGTYRMAGDLACVVTALCDEHATAIKKDGYALTSSADPPRSVTLPELPLANEEAECESAPLFTNGMDSSLGVDLDVIARSDLKGHR